MVKALLAIGLASLVAACGWDLPAPRIDASGDSDATDVACAPGTISCGESCVDPSSDLQNCGACGTSCSPGPHASGACIAGRCVLHCDTGFENCDGDLVGTGCSVPTGGGCTSCEATPSVCNGTIGYACHPVSSSGTSTYRCCRGVVACGPDNCGSSGTCVHLNDFDLCCAM